jgi:hypothetical protein
MFMLKPICILPIVCILLIPFAVRGDLLPAIDGRFFDWQEDHLVATDPQGDNTAAFDLTRVYARTDNTYLYLRFDIGKTLNLQNGIAEDGTLLLSVGTGSEDITIDFRARTAKNKSGEAVAWSDLGFQCQPTIASDEFELRLDATYLDVRPGESIEIQFSGSDSLAKKVAVELGGREPAIITHFADSDRVRLVTQNTLRNGLADEERGPKFKRLFAALNPDVYCFQEEWNEEQFLKGAASTLPPNTQLHWAGGCAVAAKELDPLQMELDRAAAAIVSVKDVNLVVISVHFKCCGYAGSKEDKLRIQQAEQLAGEIKRLKEARLARRQRMLGCC